MKQRERRVTNNYCKMKHIGIVTTTIACLNSSIYAFAPFRLSFSTRITTIASSNDATTLISMGFLDDIFNDSKQKSSTPTVTLPADFQLPEPQPLTITKTSFLPSVLQSSLALALRLATGVFVLGWQIDTLNAPSPNDENNDPRSNQYALCIGPLRIRDTSPILTTAPRPTQPLILYEYDSSPFCKRVREIMNLLDLTVEYRPCPGARQSRFSDDLFERTGRRTVPYLIDPNTDVEMFESDDQIKYLLDTYGPSKDLYDSKALWPVTFKGFSIYTATLAAMVRGMPSSQRQNNAREDNEDMKPLELWGYECSPFVKPVREKLGSLTLPHVLVSCSRGSVNRDRMVERTGRFQVPFLIDPNTGVELFESLEICDYLEACYTVKV